MWFKIKVPVPKNFSKVKDNRMFAQAFALLQVFKSTQNLKIAYFVLHTRKSLGNFEKYHIAAKFYPPFLLA